MVGVLGGGGDGVGLGGGEVVDACGIVGRLVTAVHWRYERGVGAHENDYRDL